LQDSVKAPALFSELTRKDLASMGASGGGSDRRDSKKEERRKKAAAGGSKGGGGGGGGGGSGSGGGGGGRGGRESKTQKVLTQINHKHFHSQEHVSFKLEKRYCKTNSTTGNYMVIL